MRSTEQLAGCYTQRLNRDNFADVEKLHTAVYGRIPLPNFFLNKYNTAFTGVNYIGFVAYDKQVPVAFYGVIPCFIKIGDEKVLSAQSADAMTHPDYRNKGLFIELTLLTHQLCIDERIKLVFGFPNQNSLPGFINKLGWDTATSMDRFILKAGKYTWQRVFSKLPVLKKTYTLYQQKVLKKYTDPAKGIENSVFKDGFDGIMRDDVFLKYKTYALKQVIKISNSLLWIKLNNELLIGDIDIATNDFDKVMAKLQNLARKLGINEIHFHVCKGTKLHCLFAGPYEAIPSFPVIFKQLIGHTPVDNLRFTSADIDTF